MAKAQIDDLSSNLMSFFHDSLTWHGLQVTVATQTGHESPDLLYNLDKMTNDKHCYECKVRYRDPKPQDLVMYLHAWKYSVSKNQRYFIFLVFSLAKCYIK